MLSHEATIEDRQPPSSGGSPPACVSGPDAALPEPMDVPSTREERARLHAIAEANYDFVWRTLRRLGLTPAAADDATQQVFVVVGKRLASIEVGREKAFLYRAAALLAMESRRRSRRERGDEEAVLGLADSSPGPEELAERKQARAMLDLLLSELDDEVREVFVLFELEGLSVPEISTLLDVPPGTCASRLRRAREDVQQAAKRLQARRTPTKKAGS